MKEVHRLCDMIAEAELAISGATRELRALLRAVHEGISAVRRPHPLHVTQRFRSSSDRAEPYCIRSFTRFTFAERWRASQHA